MRPHIRFGPGALAFASLAVALTARVLAKHPTNPGPADPPIRLPLPPPEPLFPAQEMETFKIQPGFQVDLAAAEPLVEDPIQITFDEKGRMWVVEFRGYMHTLEGGGEDQPTGRIKILESTQHDVFDKATIFLDHLVMPRAVLPVQGGALVAEPPELAFYKEQNGKASGQILVTHNYGSRGGEPEHMANGLMYGMDNWIYSADYPERLRWMGRKWEASGDVSRGQWGLTHDDFGRLLYFDYNEDLLRCDVLPAEYMIRNPFWPGTSGTNVKIMLDETVWPSHPTPGVNRGYQPGILRDDGTLRACTANCDPCFYRGGLFGSEYEGNVFICEPAGSASSSMAISGPIEVDALRFQLEMPSFGTLSDQEIADVLTYARRSWEHTASPVDPQMVTQIRQETRDHVGMWTAEELSKVGPPAEPKRL